MNFRDNFNSLPTITKIILDIVIVFVSTFLFLFGGIFIISKITQTPFREIVNIDPFLYTDTYKLVQVVYTISLFIIPSLLIGFLYNKNVFEFYKLNKKAEPSSFVLVFLLIIFEIPFINLLTKLNTLIPFPDNVYKYFTILEEKARLISDVILYSENFGTYLINLIVIAVLPAIGEELLFRGLIQKRLIEWFNNKHLAIFTTAFIFSAFHFQFLSFLPRFYLGIILGYLFVWSGSLWLNITAHFINNAVAVTIFYVLIKNQIPPEITEKIGTTRETFYISILSMLFTFAIILLIYKIENEKSYFSITSHKPFKNERQKHNQ